MKNILVTAPGNEDFIRRIREIAPDCEIVQSNKWEVSFEQVQNANIILGNLPAEYISGSEKLEWLQTASSGVDAYLKPGVLSDKTIVTSCTGAYGKAVSEHLFAVTLALIKKLHLYRDSQHTHSWSDYSTVTSLSDSTVLVVGAGDIGRHYARLCKAVGARVIGIKRRSGEKPDCFDEVYLSDRLDSLLPAADVVASFLPGGEKTAGLFSYERLSLMKPSAVFINGGRGNVVSCEVLYRALRDGVISGAGVDVFETEPLPADDPLWDEANIIITPHVAGDEHLEETNVNVRRIILENLNAYLHGGELKNVIDRSIGYSK